MKRDRCLQFYEDTARYNQVNALARDGGALVIHDQIFQEPWSELAMHFNCSTDCFGRDALGFDWNGSDSVLFVVNPRLCVLDRSDEAHKVAAGITPQADTAAPPQCDPAPRRLIGPGPRSFARHSGRGRGHAR